MGTSRLAAGIACAYSLFVVGCGNSGSSTAANEITGSVAVGAPMTNGILRVVDATGTLVAGGVVIADDGTFPAVALSGLAPYRLEACGDHGQEHLCLYSVANGPGRANVTPLTTAVVLLATGAPLATIMTGEVSGLDPTSVEQAQDSLANALAAMLDNAGLAANFDFIKGNLIAGSGTGYDSLLDALNVSTGVDAAPFVQITPRLGSGNVYIELGSPSVGELTVPPLAAGVSLAGVTTLFANLTAAVSSAEACVDPVTGVRSQVADDARLDMGDDTPLVGGDDVAAAICAAFSGGQGGGPSYGWKLADPDVRRCEFTGVILRCRVDFFLKTAAGVPVQLVDIFGASFVNGVWKLLGDMDVVPIRSTTRALRTQRIDDPTTPDTYARAIGFEIRGVADLECARISQPNASGASVPLAIYKRASLDAYRLSLWTVDGESSVRSLDPVTGALRDNDDPWLALPEGMESDDLIRNFQQGGRTVSVSLFSDAACSTPLSVEGQSELIVDVSRPPPIWAELGALPWPALTDTARAALVALAAPSFASGNYDAAWTYPQASVLVEQGTLCTDGDCTAGNGSWLGNMPNTPGATSLSVPFLMNGIPLDSTTYKLFALSGRTSDGLQLKANSASCPMVPAGGPC